MKPWSYSTLDKFETCARQFHEVKVVKSVVEPETEWQLWGKEVHTSFEDCINSNGVVPLPDKMKHWRPLIDKVLAMKGTTILTEVAVALDGNFRSVEWDSPTCWTRGVIDVLVLGKTSALVIDWKSGKRKPTEQLDLYAAYIFALYPHIKIVHTAAVWLQDKKIDKKTIKRSETYAIWQGFIERAARLRAAYQHDAWPPRPSGLCKRHCVVTACAYNGRKEAVI